jgi:uridylate kinase
VKVAVVVGGGNILRGRDAGDADPATADKAGMLATVVNGLRLTEYLGRTVPVGHFAAVGVPGTVRVFDLWQARAELASGRILVLSGGTGNPFFSTDSAAALRAAELGMDAILKATRVAGVYSDDPEKNPKARLYRRLSFEQALAQRLRVMDLTAFAFCMERRIPIVVFAVNRPKAILDIVRGKRIGSLIC